MSFAEKTSVPVMQSQADIKKVLTKYNATSFVFGETAAAGMVQFDLSGRRVKFILPLPCEGKAKTKKGQLASKTQVEQMVRSKWRSLWLAIKAKLDSVDSGITTFEQEFMAHILLPNGKTVGDVVLPEIESSYQNKKMPPLLGMQ